MGKYVVTVTRVYDVEAENVAQVAAKFKKKINPTCISNYRLSSKWRDFIRFTCFERKENQKFKIKVLEKQDD